MIKQWILCLSILLSLLSRPHSAFCSQGYYLDGNPALLYKVINWWYDCLPGESQKLCGHSVTYRSQGDLQVEYHEDQSIIKIKLNSMVSERISILKPTAQAPLYLICAQLNETYFGNASAHPVPVAPSTVGPFEFRNMTSIYARKIQAIRENLGFEIEGRIGGLIDGRIALHTDGEFLKGCPMNTGITYGPLRVKLVNFGTKEVLSEYFSP